uniref:Uncharacterized protein n=1 Tax=Setaria digitata TaxID=48799 RepID=A0A915PNB1_9BILA
MQIFWFIFLLRYGFRKSVEGPLIVMFYLAKTSQRRLMDRNSWGNKIKDVARGHCFPIYVGLEYGYPRSK